MTLCDPMDCIVHGIQKWKSPGQKRINWSPSVFLTVTLHCNTTDWGSYFKKKIAFLFIYTYLFVTALGLHCCA